METNLYTITVLPMMKTLESFSGILDTAIAHAEKKGTDWYPGTKRMEDLLQSRLVFDQFQLVHQIQVACDNAKNGTSRIAAIEVPKFEDNEKTGPEVKERLEKTIAYLKTIKPEQLNGREESRVEVPYHPKMTLSAFEYATLYLMPNFYFHIVTAYSIIRKNGVEIGKSDLLNHLPWKTQ